MTSHDLTATAAWSATAPLPARQSAAAPLGLPSRWPRALAAATPALVRSRMIPRSNSAMAPNTWKISIPPGVPDEGHHAVSLTPTPGGGTRFRMVEEGYTTTEARDLSQSGLEQCVDKMAALVDGVEH